MLTVITDHDHYPDDDGAYFTRYVLLSADGETEKDVLEYCETVLEMELNGTHCKHEYDCCGCWYCSGVDAHNVTPNLWVIVQGWSLNI